MYSCISSRHLPQLIAKPVSYTHAASQKSISPNSSQSIQFFDVPVTITHITDHEDENVIVSPSNSFTVSPSSYGDSIVQGPHLFGENCCVSETAAGCLNPPVASPHSECTSFQVPSQLAETCPEIEVLVDKRYKEMVHLAASLNKENKDTFFTMDSKGLV